MQGVPVEALDPAVPPDDQVYFFPNTKKFITTELYSPDSLLVLGDTWNHRHALHAMGGSWNYRLHGFVFSRRWRAAEAR